MYLLITVLIFVTIPYKIFCFHDYDEIVTTVYAGDQDALDSIQDFKEYTIEAEECKAFYGHEIVGCPYEYPEEKYYTPTGVLVEVTDNDKVHVDIGHDMMGVKIERIHCRKPATVVLKKQCPVFF